MQNYYDFGAPVFPFPVHNHPPARRKARRASWKDSICAKEKKKKKHKTQTQPPRHRHPLHPSSVRSSHQSNSSYSYHCLAFYCPVPMLIGLCGLHFVGKRALAEFLVEEHGFHMIENAEALMSSSPEDASDSDENDKSNEIDANDVTDIKETQHIIPSHRLLRQCWKPDINVVIRNIRPHHPCLPTLLKRPYFLLVFLDATFRTRLRRAVTSDLVPKDGWEQLARLDDHDRYPPSRHTEALSGLERLSRLRIHNDFSTLAKLRTELRTFNFTDKERLRPSWDTYFMSLAKLAAERTNCMKRRVGCVIARNKRIVATGYNGTPSGVTNCLDGGCGRCNGAASSQGVGLDLCLCLHAEENAIIEAGRERCEGGILYTNLFPCILCAKKIVQSGIRRIVFETRYATDGAAEPLLRSGGVRIDQFDRGDVTRGLEGAVLPPGS
ncbi:unnamed protein product [Chondrus crispus]|uniref:Deoxycytidylate deaminase n=1 Tax=Chondrus crispus TaxID=2769 RepID=R7QF28_CHOCR|nr:unnamed protein product [Chondrus crispus]CDF36383.1 unnamed protein product [Chondrus crispus]|eukprot:XP_005716202.1 unnamed protein product [Chondrus crispus]